MLALLIFCLIAILVLRLAHMRFLKKKATVDALTQINNRLGFDEELKRRLKGQEDGKFTLVMVDVDDFKLFNDLYGHQVGDMVLKQVSRGLKEAVTGCGLVGLPRLVDGRLDAFPGISVIVDPGLDPADRIVAEYKLLQLLDFGDIIGIGR